MNKMNCIKGNDTKINQMENCYKQFSGRLENRDVNNYIKTAIENKEIAMGLIARATGCVQALLKEYGFQSFPVFTFVGKPGAGKTVIAEAVMESSEAEVDAWAKTAEIKKWNAVIQTEEHRKHLVVMDDVRCSSDKYSANRSTKNADWFLRDCFKGHLPIGIITIENDAMKCLIDSSKDRLMVCPVYSGYLRDEEISSVLAWMSSKEGKEKLTNLFDGFSGQTDLSDVGNQLQVSRSKCDDTNIRRNDMDFLVKYIATKFVNYLQKLRIDIDSSKVTDNLNSVLERNRLIKLSDDEMLLFLLEETLVNNAKDILAPKAISLCTGIFSTKCRRAGYNRNYCKNGTVNELIRGCEKDRIQKYYPLECVHDSTRYLGVLFEKVKDIYRFPYNKFSEDFENESLLVLPAENLLRMINVQLSYYSSINKIHYPEYKEKSLLKLLWERNLILYRIQESGANRYKFPYLAYVAKKQKRNLKTVINPHVSCGDDDCNYNDYDNYDDFDFQPDDDWDEEDEINVEKELLPINGYVWLRIPNSIRKKILEGAARIENSKYGCQCDETDINKYNQFSNEWSVFSKCAGAPGIKSEF